MVSKACEPKGPKQLALGRFVSPSHLLSAVKANSSRIVTKVGEIGYEDPTTQELVIIVLSLN